MIQRCIGWFERTRCVFSRFDERADSYFAFVKLAILRTLPGYLSLETLMDLRGQPDGRVGLLLQRRESIPDPEHDDELARILGRERWLAA